MAPDTSRTLPPAAPARQRTGAQRPPQAVLPWCPMCDGQLDPEHAHYRCGSCGWRDSCCD